MMIESELRSRHPTYRDGTPAQLGDLVRGESYQGPIVGTVIGLNPNGDTPGGWTIQVAYLETFPVPAAHARIVAENHRAFRSRGVLGCGADGSRAGGDKVMAVAAIGYGNGARFERIEG